MNRLTSIQSFVLLTCVLLLALMTGCTEKTINAPAPAIDGNLVINIEASPAETMQLVTFYRLTVSGHDMKPVVDTLWPVSGPYLVGEVQVPVGERRLFVLEGIMGAAATTERVIYRGQTVAAVRPGAITTLNIVLRPVVPMVRLSPIMPVLAPGQPLELQVEIHNILNLASITIDFSWPWQLFGDEITVELSDRQSQDVSFYWGGEGSYMGLTVADTVGGTIVNQHGNGVLANITLQPLIQVGPEGGTGALGIFEIDTVWSYIILGDTTVPEQVLYEHSEIRLLPMADRVVVFPDPVLDAHIRNLVSIGAGEPIMLSNISDITYFYFPTMAVTDLTGIENMINLTWMDMSHNPVGDISVLAELPRLITLYAENNAIADITPLTGLTRLQTLDLAANQIVDLRPLAGMHDLDWLDLNVNQISDISPLSSLTELEWLYLNSNQIVDISALQSLTGIWWLELQGNQIVDLLPLVNNPGLGSGDQVDLRNNGSLASDPVQFGHIQTLVGREVIVFY